MEYNSQDQQTVRFEVEAIIFSNPENGYAVVCGDDGFGGKVKARGNLATVRKGQMVLARGRWENYRSYGRQFSVDSWEVERPASEEGIRRYLASGLIYGIGEVLSDRIVDVFGAATLDIIDNDPQRLREVPGIGAKKAESIISRWKEQAAVRQIMVFLKEHGVTDGLAAKIYRTYGDGSIDAITENPYRMCDEVRGVGFKTADVLARSIGISEDSPFRLDAGILHALREAQAAGHMYLPAQRLLAAAKDLLGADERLLVDTLDRLSDRGTVLRARNEDDGVWIPLNYAVEKAVARRLAEAATRRPTFTVTDAMVDDVQRDADIVLAPAQRSAVRTALTRGCTVITGGPGTGKTTTLRAVISVAERSAIRILLASPTGKAAKRMEEATGRPAKTVHRLLEAGPNGFRRCAENPLEGDVLVVDEVSMIDEMLMSALLSAMPPHMRLVLVGDADQLPSVGAGNCLREIISSGVVPVVRLAVIFRQAEGSDIIRGAHAINAGRVPDFSRKRDLWFVRRETPEEIAAAIEGLAQRWKDGGGSEDDLQVLAPQKRGTCGTEELNARLRRVFNPEGVAAAGTLRVGDRVVNLKNDYENGVFNGDQGMIVSRDEEERTFTVRYDSGDVTYDATDADLLLPSWAMTVHRSQGSEFRRVVIPVTEQNWTMLQRTLLYTAVTRASWMCILVGTERALAQAVRNNAVRRRYTRLAAAMKAAAAQAAE